MATSQSVLEFLQTERTCVLSVLLSNSTVHSAPLTYWYDSASHKLYMSTDKNSEKMSWRREGRAGTQAAIVVGGQENKPFLIQMRGLLEAVDARHVPPRVKRAYLDVADERYDPMNDTHTFIMFSPTWDRYSDSEGALAQMA